MRVAALPRTPSGAIDAAALLAQEGANGTMWSVLLLELRGGEELPPLGDAHHGKKVRETAGRVFGDECEAALSEAALAS